MFGKGFHSKLEKVFSFSKDRKIYDDPPPPYILPDEFIKAKIKEDQLAVLRDYDTVIVLDDSGSMEHLWPQARKALSTLAVVASRYDEDGIDIHFLNHGKVKDRRFKVKGLISARDVEELFDRVRPEGPTPLGDCLERITEPVLRNLEKGKPQKKTNYLVITDGIPTDDAESSIVQIAERLEKAGAVLSQLGIQLVQIGTNEEAREYLSALDNNLKKKHGIRDIVDTEPFYNCEVTAVRLTKLLLGGINRKVDKSS
ncbi:hypothetical protein BJ322DRAFT_1111094 [Thelephora terrestris]|uniref:VWFA domain-containing protein n=1 Tax=Thelephora terrestris TaxID=56493 RepID=A0A9P6H9W1_9AGAM|nr:hypothetical protein BJ322DRAFT_1111094 [Thelephora terrestris]